MCSCCERLFFQSSLRTLTTEFLQKMQQSDASRPVFQELQYDDGKTGAAAHATTTCMMAKCRATTGLWV